MRRPPREKLLVEFGARVAEARRQQGLTQEALAAQVGKAARYVQQVESGRQNVTLRTLGRFAEALGVDASSLLK